MKKFAFTAVISLLVFFAFSFGAFAQEDTGDKIMGDFSSVVPPEANIDVGEGLEADLSFSSLCERVVEALSEKWGDASSFFLMLMGFAVIISVCDGVYVSDDPSIRRASSSAVSAVASVSIFSGMYGIIAATREGLLSLSDFFSNLIPILTAVNASSGALNTAKTQATNMNITLAMLEKFSTGMLLPLTFALFSLALAASCTDSGIASVAKGIKSIFSFGVGIICTMLAAAIALQSLVASAKDNAALRAARYAASGMIPIVGSSVASALSTLAGGMAFVRNTVGGASVAVIIAISIFPLVMLLLYRLAFSVSIIFLEFLGSEGGVRCFSAFRTALDALIAVYSISVLVCVVELVVFIRSGVSV